MTNPHNADFFICDGAQGETRNLQFQYTFSMYSKYNFSYITKSSSRLSRTQSSLRTLRHK